MDEFVKELTFKRLSTEIDLVGKRCNWVLVCLESCCVSESSIQSTGRTNVCLLNGEVGVAAFIVTVCKEKSTKVPGSSFCKYALKSSLNGCDEFVDDSCVSTP